MFRVVSIDATSVYAQKSSMDTASVGIFKFFFKKIFEPKY